MINGTGKQEINKNGAESNHLCAAAAGERHGRSRRKGTGSALVGPWRRARTAVNQGNSVGVRGLMVEAGESSASI